MFNEKWACQRGEQWGEINYETCPLSGFDTVIMPPEWVRYSDQKKSPSAYATSGLNDVMPVTCSHICVWDGGSIKWMCVRGVWNEME